MRTLARLLLLLAMVPASAEAGLTEADLGTVRLSPREGAQVPATLTFRDPLGRPASIVEALAGHPGLLIPVDYTCRSLCGPTLAVVAQALRETGLTPGSDYRLVVIGIDAKDGSADARAFAADRIAEPDVAAAASVLTGDAPTVEGLTQVLGYHAAYDPDNDQFAHPSGVVALTPQGRVSQVLSPLAFDRKDLRLALVQAGEGRIGALADRLALLCYGFDPVHGVYTPAIRRILQVAGAATATALALILVVLHRRRNRPEAAS